MEISWKWLNLYLWLLLIGFCRGFPLNLEDTNTGHAQFLTGIAAVLITVGSIVLAGCLCCQRRKGFQDDKEKEFHNSPVVASAAPIIEHGHVNPIANGEFTIFTPLSPPHFNNNVFLANEQVIRRTSDDYVWGDIDVSPWFDGPERDFPRIKLKYIKELGKGCFGKVVEGAAQDLDPGRAWTPVVVRILDAASNNRDRILFLNDALIYLAPPHPNVLGLKGRCLNAAPLLLLQESCSGGDLKSRLKTADSGDRILQWCCQLTSALRHLHNNGFIHPDLASRNCLLTESLTLKLGDYSLSASKYPEDYYKGGEPLISVRWRSPESLDCTPTTIQPKTLTKEANIWTLGVVMWEICEDGSQPYNCLDDDEVISRVFGPEGLRLDGPSKPRLYSDYIFRLIRMCWNNSESRPKVAQIDMMLSDLLQVHRNTHDPLLNAIDDFDNRWESFKPNSIVKTDNQNVSIDIDGDGDRNSISKPMSPSLNNLHGSLDNLSCIPPVHSEARNQNFLKGLSDATIDLESISTESDKSDLNLITNIYFELGPSHGSKNNKSPDSPGQNDSLTDSMIFKQQGSSESDTEEENWRRKVERGAYSEKVRLKSRSVADLMILTHVDYSESESETPMPSIDYKSNRNFRKSNLENSSLNFSSEGNLLNIEDTFEKELKKLQVERRDSLLFVPDNKSQNNSNLSLLHELNSPTEIKPMNQIYNIFNMTIDKYGSLRVSGSKLNDIINIGDDTRLFNRQDSENKSDLGYATLHNSERNSDFGSVDGEHLLEDKTIVVKSEIEERLKNCELLTNNNVHKKDQLQENNNGKFYIVSDLNGERKREAEKQHTRQNLPDILASLDQDHGQVNVDLLESNLVRADIKNEDNDPFETASVYNDRIEPKNDLTRNIEPDQTHGCDVHSNIQTIVPKLSDMVLNNHKLRQFVSDTPLSNLEVGKVVSKESQIVPDLYSENVESSDSVNAYLNINRHANAETFKRNDHDKCVDAINSLASTKIEVYTESLLPEIKQRFIKGPNMLESINSIEAKSYPDIPRTTTNSNKLSVFKNEPNNTNNSRDLTEVGLDLNIFLNAERNNAIADTPEISTSDLCESELYQNDNHSDCDLNAKINDIEVTDLLEDEEFTPKEEGDSISNVLSNENVDASIPIELENKVGVSESQCAEIDIEATAVQKTPEKNEPGPKPKTKVAFDLSKSQQETMPNALTHTAVFTSTPFRKKQDHSLPSENVYSSLNLFGAEPADDETDVFSSNFAPVESNRLESENSKLNYSLETWDNFLGKSFDSSRESNENLFDSFTSEPQSMLFLEDDCQNEPKSKDCKDTEQCNGTFLKDEVPTQGQPANSSCIRDNTFVKNDTFVVEEKTDGTFVMEDTKNGTFVMEKPGASPVDENAANGHWETGGGWFLHPQSNNDKLSGDIEPQPSTSKGTYIGFGMDDEIMTAIRNELLEKLPHAQGVSHENVKEEEEWNQTERNEVFLRYNVYNTPLSPIPEESSFDENDEELVTTGENTPKLNDTDSDWSEQCELEFPPALSSQTNDSALTIPNHGHTPSQSSCCSNDTLFNFDDFAPTNDKENIAGSERPETVLNDDVFETDMDLTNTEPIHFTDGSDDKTVQNSGDKTESETYSYNGIFKEETEPIIHASPDGISNISMSLESASQEQLSLNDFLTNERNHTSSSSFNLMSFNTKVVAPLPSPEDKPWKSLPASLLTYDTIQKPTLTIDNVEIVPKTEPTILNEASAVITLESSDDNNLIASSEIKRFDEEEPQINIDVSNQIIDNCANDIATYENMTTAVEKDDKELNLLENSSDAINSETISPMYESLDKPSDDNRTITQSEVAEYENVLKQQDNTTTNIYENDINNEVDYVNIENIDDKQSSHEYINSIDQHNSLNLVGHIRDDHDMFGVLTDIRFSGPIDSQLMSTSFSESNDVDEQDWDSGSDTRSSSSGEFIWKEGEHEESLKALRAAPHDVLEDIKPMEEITEESTESDVSTSTSDEEGENLEFVPSAWDKFATPTKSALRSPEKSLDRSESKKSKGVWFKKQKYHCVYEYPREPESPVLQSQDLWKPQIDYTAFSDWEFDAESYLPPPTADSEITPSTFTFKPKINNSRRSLYYLTSPCDIQGDGSSTSSNTDEEFIVPPSSRPLDTNAAVCSQFFPGASNWIENVTPDSGLDDSTPGSISDSTEFPENYLACKQVLPLKKLAAQVINKNKEINKGSRDVLGGLRHTRNKLKLDLPPSPSAFTSSKTFTVEPLQEPVVLREKPTFSTFGKSRFLVQHVDTPTDDKFHHDKNVCFDVLPYKPINIIPIHSNDCQENNDVTYEPLKRNFDELSVFSNKKELFIKGEASLLDSADEDSGIESSTLERKMNNIMRKENVPLE